ncbi:glycosyl hydrolase family 71-domain-containing protein [Immersiella caudata]|uniref:Glycosyl hydrolase family 71-domain-containing protein n=1 Tax=Immersiella caudata TaxID=314043 RepID=A0AA39X2R6_9PEZI|nr:glycosyl hydrolase family 71-domain-containing protein [Immersiella caudata]
MGPGVLTTWLITWLITCLLAARNVRANVQVVFAHFMVGNTASYSVADWQDDISKAAAAHIDGFVLKMARGEATNGASLANAFTAAKNLRSTFNLLFSFVYAGNGLWDKADVIALINTYAPNAAYYRGGSQPLVSTFEGPAASVDWVDIKAATPAASSCRAVPPSPEGPNSMSTFTDNSYRDALGGAPYMMPVAPWFYTNMPGFRKNWLWRGDDLWFDRCVHLMTLQPAYVQIISWNDYGCSGGANIGRSEVPKSHSKQWHRH